MKKSLHLAALCGVAILALFTGGCADVGPGGPGPGPGYAVGVGYGGYGLYDGPYYGGYGPYYGNTVVVGGYRHAGYYGRHHFYGGGYGGRSYSRFSGRSYNRIGGTPSSAGRVSARTVNGSFGGGAGRIGAGQGAGGAGGGGHR